MQKKKKWASRNSCYAPNVESLEFAARSHANNNTDI